MKNTKQNVIKLLEAKHLNAKICANCLAEHVRTESAEYDIAMAIAYKEVIKLLTNADYFNDIWDIYFE